MESHYLYADIGTIGRYNSHWHNICFCHYISLIISLIINLLSIDLWLTLVKSKNSLKTSYVTLLNMLISTSVRVTRRTTLAAIISTGMMNDTQDMMTNMPRITQL